jgi:hypothetical protein
MIINLRIQLLVYILSIYLFYNFREFFNCKIALSSELAASDYELASERLAAELYQ